MIRKIKVKNKKISINNFSRPVKYANFLCRDISTKIILLERDV